MSIEVTLNPISSNTNCLAQSYYLYLQMLGPLFRLCNPFPQLGFVPSLQTDLEELRVRRQRRWDIIALNGIDDRVILCVLGLGDGERSDEANVGCEQLTVGKVRPGTHARSGTVGVVGSAALWVVKEPLGSEFSRISEPFIVVISCPGVLFQTIRAIPSLIGREGLTMKNVVPAGMTAPLYSMSLMLVRGRQMGITVQKRKVSLTSAVTKGTFSSTKHFSQASPSG